MSEHRNKTKQQEKRVPWRSKITEIEQDSLKTHGIDQCEIIREYSYEEMVFFLLKARRPTSVERNLLRAVLVAHISHGITGQSTLAVMEAADCRSDFLHALIGGFSVGAGIYHQGSLRTTMIELQEIAKLPENELEEYVKQRLARRERIMGFGHRFHHRDPRAEALLEIAEAEGFSGRHLNTVRRLKEILERLKGVSINIEAPGAGILLDLGFDPLIGHLFIILGRSPMFAAVYLERLSQGRRPFQRIEVCDVIEIDRDE